ncbi:hypothetical protein [Streptomyces sp. NPDC017993]|uniref:hypothetical protein n=1 Tax=Streptomyces sp. NPDC017993 TaxID=3365027 RepID=UPI0037AA6EF3
MVLQAGCFGYLSGRLTPSGSLLLSCVGFAIAALVFTALHTVRRRQRSPLTPVGDSVDAVEGTENRRLVRRLLWLMNLLTALTFVSFYVALAWIPATLASGIETAIGPLALAVLALLLARGERPTPRAWLSATALAIVGGTLAWRLTDAGSISPASVAGLALVAVAGVGASGLALVSKALGALGADPVTVTAHRFHLTYLGAGAIFLLEGGSPYESGVPPALLPLIGVAAVTIPLFVLQVGLQRANPMVAMTILTTLPGLTYLSEAAWGGNLDAGSLALTALLVALAALSAAPGSRARKGRATPSGGTTEAQVGAECADLGANPPGGDLSRPPGLPDPAGGAPSRTSVGDQENA